MYSWFPPVPHTYDYEHARQDVQSSLSCAFASARDVVLVLYQTPNNGSVTFPIIPVVISSFVKSCPRVFRLRQVVKLPPGKIFATLNGVCEETTSVCIGVMERRFPMIEDDMETV